MERRLYFEIKDSKELQLGSKKNYAALRNREHADDLVCDCDHADCT